MLVAALSVLKGLKGEGNKQEDMTGEGNKEEGRRMSIGRQIQPCDHERLMSMLTLHGTLLLLSLLPYSLPLST